MQFRFAKARRKASRRAKYDAELNGADLADRPIVIQTQPVSRVITNLTAN